MNFKALNGLVFILLAFTANAQDTLKINLQHADHLFLERNLYLLAASMNIEAQKAQIIQAKIYPNPIFTADLNVYDPENNKLFHVGKTGQKSFQLEQLIVLGGKRKSEIEMAKTNTKIAELALQELLLQLKFQLHTDLHAAGQLQVLLAHYTEQLNLLQDLVSVYETQVKKGNIALKELVRLKGAYLKLNNERASLLKEYFETQSALNILLQTSSVVVFEFTEADIAKYMQLTEWADLLSSAKENRPDLQIMQQNKILATQYLAYQKRLAVPDINVFANYDQRSGAFNNQVNLGIAIPLPLWNRNQGNIKTANYNTKAADYNLQAKENELYSELKKAYAQYAQAVVEYTKAKKLYNQDFEITVKGMMDNFQKRNINIVEFIDFFESYNETLNEISRINTSLISSAEQINLLTGKDIYK